MIHNFENKFCLLALPSQKNRSNEYLCKENESSAAYVKRKQVASQAVDENWPAFFALIVSKWSFDMPLSKRQFARPFNFQSYKKDDKQIYRVKNSVFRESVQNRSRQFSK